MNDVNKFHIINSIYNGRNSKQEVDINDLAKSGIETMKKNDIKMRCENFDVVIKWNIA